MDMERCSGKGCAFDFHCWADDITDDTSLKIAKIALYCEGTVRFGISRVRPAVVRVLMIC